MKLDFFHKYAQHLPNFEKKSFKNIYFSFSNVNELYKRGNKIIFNIGVSRPRPISVVHFFIKCPNFSKGGDKKTPQVEIGLTLYTLLTTYNITLFFKFMISLSLVQISFCTKFHHLALMVFQITMKMTLKWCFGRQPRFKHIFFGLFYNIGSSYHFI